MKLTDLVELAKAGYSFSQIKELLEYVETSPAVMEAAPINPDEVNKHIEENVQVPQPQINETINPEEKINGEDILDGLLGGK